MPYRMRQYQKIFIGIFLLLPVFLFATEKSNQHFWIKTKNTIANDYANFYSMNNLKCLFGEICISGIIANTNLDGDIQNWYQESIRNDNTNQFSRLAKPAGNVYEPIGIYAGLALLGGLTRHTTLGEAAYQSGTKSLRAIIVGAPVVGILQFALGASRPNEDNSRWHPFQDTNSVSGHAFMGAIPFLTISKMVEPLALKTILYIGSTATGLSRINDNKHYFSQVLAGWWFAYLAVNSVDREKGSKIKLSPTFSAYSWKMQLYFSF